MFINSPNFIGNSIMSSSKKNIDFKIHDFIIINYYIINLKKKNNN